MRILHVFPTREITYGEDQDDLGLAHFFLLGYIDKKIDISIDFKIVRKDIIKAMYEFKPDIVAITAMTYNFYNASLVATKAKEIGSTVIVGGHHLSILPEQLTNDMDLGVIGEGEETYLELINLYRQGKWDPNYWKDVKGVVFRTPNNNIFVTPPRILIRNLDSVGHPARELGPVTPSTQRSMITSRGCPYSCIFCSQTRFWKNTIRFHSPEYVVDEIERIHNFSKTDYIKIDDAIFLIGKGRLKEILRVWEKHPLYNRIRFTCYARANLIDDEMVLLAKRMGIDGVVFGFESNNPDSLTYLKGGNVTPADNQRAYDILTRHKITVTGTFIIGVPKETKEQIMDTYSFIKRNPLLVGDTFHLVPLPGTPIWDYASKRGLVSDNMDFRIFGGQETGKEALFLSEKIAKQEMIQLLKMFNKFRKKRRLFLAIRHGLRHIFKDPLSMPRRAKKVLNEIFPKPRIKEKV